jgi:hypothetical protein
MEDQIGGDVPRMRKKINMHKYLAGKPEGKRSLGRSKRMCEDDIKTGA